MSKTGTQHKRQILVPQVSDLSGRLKSGRHRCNCQARVHPLVRNCLKCGRIVCEQEGSGPCFHCGNLVCTRDERQVIESGSKEGLQLYSRLMSTANSAASDADTGNPPPGYKSLGPAGSRRPVPPQSFYGTSLASLGQTIQQANEFRQKLLIADKNEEITHVHDLDSDYFSLELNPYLNGTERNAIVRRKEQLRELSLKNKQTFLMDLDMQNKQVLERKRANIETVNDPVIKSILMKSVERQRLENNKLLDGDGEYDQPDDTGGNSIDRTFIPRYRPELSQSSVTGAIHIPAIPIRSANNSNRPVQPVHCVALKQPYASMLADGALSSIPWRTQVIYSGQVVIAALSDTYETKLFHDGHTFLPSSDEDDGFGTSDYNRDMELLPRLAVVGRANLKECISAVEFAEEFPLESKKWNTIDSPPNNSVGECFFLVFKDQDPLPMAFPFLAPCELLKLKRTLVSEINKLLPSDSLMDCFDLASA